MRKFVFGFAFVFGLLLFPRVSEAATEFADFRPENLREVQQDSRAVETYIVPAYAIRAYRNFRNTAFLQQNLAGITQRTNDLHQNQMKTVQARAAYVLPRRVQRSMENNARAFLAPRPQVTRPTYQIRRKNIGMVQMRIGGHAMRFDDYVQRTRRTVDFG